MVNKNFDPTYFNHLYIIRKGLLDYIKILAPKLKGSILDFGCGSKPYKSLFTNCSDYIGLDFNNEGHNHINEKIDFFYDGKTIPFNDQHFDNIFSSEVFEHLFNLEEILPELNRVLKLNGIFFITCPFVWVEHEVPNDYARYTQFALKHLAEKNGFKIEVFEKSGNFRKAIQQLKLVYFNDVKIAKYKILFFRKLARKIIVPTLNIYYEKFTKCNQNDKTLYLNNIVIMRKIHSK